MPQPRQRAQDQQKRNRQDQSPNKQGQNPPRQAQDARDKRTNPDRYPDQGKQAQKPSDVRYPEQDPSGEAGRPDAVEETDAANRPDRGQRDRDLN